MVPRRTNPIPTKLIHATVALIAVIAFGCAGQLPVGLRAICVAVVLHGWLCGDNTIIAKENGV